MKFYESISALPRPKSYLGKCMLIAFLGTHLPLIAFAVYVVTISESVTLFSGEVLLILIATLLSTVATLSSLNGILYPITKTSEALSNYMEAEKLPNLPRNFDDSVGTLMKNTDLLIHNIDKLIKDKNRLISIISHDARSPLSSIIIASQMIDESEDPDEIRKLNKLVMVSANNQLSVMNNLLQISGSNMDKIEIKKEKTAVQDILSKVVEQNQIQLDFKNLTLKINNSIPDDNRFLLDEIKIMSAINNLIQNAIKFSPKGEEIELNANKANESLVIEVIDNGIGMDNTLLTKLFKKETSSHQKGTDNEDGFGLGLWIVREFVKAHNGDVTVESEKGEGSKFTISIPLETT